MRVQLGQALRRSDVDPAPRVALAADALRRHRLDQQRRDLRFGAGNDAGEKLGDVGPDAGEREPGRSLLPDGVASERGDRSNASSTGVNRNSPARGTMVVGTLETNCASRERSFASSEPIAEKTVSCPGGLALPTGRLETDSMVGSGKARPLRSRLPDGKKMGNNESYNCRAKICDMQCRRRRSGRLHEP